VGVRGAMRETVRIILTLFVLGLLMGGFLAVLGPPPPKAVTGRAEARGTPSGLGDRVRPGEGPLNPAITLATDLLGGGIGKLLVTTNDSAIVPNDGLRANITDYAASTLPPASSFQVSAEEQIGVYEAVMGIFGNTATVPVAFFSVFLLKNDSTVHEVYWPDLPLIAGKSYEFIVQHATSTVWVVTVNGQLFGLNSSAASFDFGAASATQAANTSFAETAAFGSTTTTPAQLNIPLAFAFHRSNGWYLPQAGATSFSGSPGTQWGVEGRLQHATLAPGELVTGTGIANVTNGTGLWTGGPVPVRIGVSFPVTATLATSIVRVSAELTDLSGGAIPGAPVYFNDSLGGLVVPPSVTTNASGGGAAYFESPNSSRLQRDNVTATSTLFGYVGSGVGGITLIPPLQVLITANPASPSVSPSGSIEVTFRATFVNGSVAANVGVGFTTAGGGALTPIFAVTDPGGNTAVVFIAPATKADYPLNATVANSGYWGHIALVVHVGSGVPTFWDRYGSGITVAIVVGVLAVLAVLLALYFRRRRRAIPAMPIRRYLLEMRRPRAEQAPAPAPPPPPPSRTPPSGGTP